MIRIYFVFEDSLDDSGINLSYVDVLTRDPGKAFQRVKQAAASGELWERLYPREEDRSYVLIPSKMTYLDITALPRRATAGTVLR